MSLRGYLFIIFCVKFDKVKLINSYFRFADKSKIEELKKKVLFSDRQLKIFELYYVQGKDCGKDMSATDWGRMADFYFTADDEDGSRLVDYYFQKMRNKMK